ncbi:MAG TPA: magnesium transporter [Candidatus Acidoferrum sp.]|nr:magnesium transporter [Candidatus Acidoferrum sp.]
MASTHSLTAADELLDAWPSLRRSQRLSRFQALPHEQMDNFFLALDASAQSRLLLDLPEGEHRIFMRLLAPDDAADVIQESPKSVRQSLLSQLDDRTQQEVKALLAFREDIAGGLMNPRFARLRPDSSINEAISYLRHQLGHVETIYYAYVLDENQTLLGVVGLKDLVAADPNKMVKDVMTTKIYKVSPNTDQSEVAHLLTKHGIKAVPVVDEKGRMKGIVTADDLIDVLREEDTEDIQKMGGMEALDGPYLETTFPAMIKKRAGWLVILFLGEMLTATAMGHFEHEIERAVVLSLFIPLLISSGGNSGSQATSLIIRALALREVRLKDWWRVIRREVAAGVVLGAILGVVGMIRILIWQSIWHTYGQHYLLIATTIAFSLLGVVTFGTLAGSMLPFILRKCGLDPASASAPFVATLVDVTGLIIYFSVAKIILTGTLL